AAAAAPGASKPAPRAMREQLLAGMVSILSALDRYDEARGGEQAFDRLVQWKHAARGAAKPAARAASLDSLPGPAREAGMPIMERKSFDAPGDVVAIRDRCWLAAVARTARGTATDELAVAEGLFRWTVRSLAAVSDPPMVPSDALPGTRWFLPGEILLAGRASPAQRAWIFLELLRQSGIDGVMLATPAAGGGPPRPWVPAAIIAGEAYLFEPTYGMPIPGPGGAGVATLRQAVADPAILNALSVPDRPYPVQAETLAAGVAVLGPADPWSLSTRMAELDGELAAAEGVRVAVDVDAILGRATAAVAAGDGAAVQRGIWAFPWETVARRGAAAAAAAEELAPLQVPVPDPQRPGGGFRALFAGRVREFRGEYEGPGGAKAAYLAARVSRRELAGALAGVPESQAAAITSRLSRMKEDATYWLGLVMLAEGQDEAAVDYLQRMTLEAAPDSRWTDAARVNLAAALERLGKTAEAVSLLREDGSPQRFGSRIVADRLAAAAPD
ncbi:MAG: tetratricopeptide repeat protein, partial [Planctomycetota bacterium]